MLWIVSALDLGHFVASVFACKQAQSSSLDETHVAHCSYYPKLQPDKP